MTFSALVKPLKASWGEVSSHLGHDCQVDYQDTVKDATAKREARPKRVQLVLLVLPE